MWAGADHGEGYREVAVIAVARVVCSCACVLAGYVEAVGAASCGVAIAKGGVVSRIPHVFDHHERVIARGG